LPLLSYKDIFTDMQQALSRFASCRNEKIALEVIALIAALVQSSSQAVFAMREVGEDLLLSKRLQIFLCLTPAYWIPLLNILSKTFGPRQAQQAVQEQS